MSISSRRPRVLRADAYRENSVWGMYCLQMHLNAPAAKSTAAEAGKRDGRNRRQNNLQCAACTFALAKVHVANGGVWIDT